VAAMLGADEMGFSTAPLIATGCIMMRACHLNTCPVGIATQDPELRKRFKGTPEHVVNFFFFVAEEVREILASVGLRSLDEATGRVDLLGAADAIDHWKARGVDLTHLLTHIELGGEGSISPPRRRVEAPPEVLGDALDWELVERSRLALERREPVRMALGIRNRNRCVGGILSSHIAERCGAAGLEEDAIVVDFEGSAGQSFGGWLAPGVTFMLRGEANDYAGKGLSGGVFAIRPREGMGEHFKAEENVIVGNTVLYGATAGRAFFRGLAGERFGVRNSGAWAVVEGVGDHGCEYMTGGRVVVLGPTGRNFAAGMSGGVAYVLDEDGAFPKRCNMGMVGFDVISEADAIELRAMIEEHRRRTGSPVAARVLEEWEALLGKGAFVKVMPHDYKRVLRELAEQEAQAARGAAENGGIGAPRPLDAVGEAGV
jgi:glutamate synthase domain-containing protein 3